MTKTTTQTTAQSTTKTKELERFYFTFGIGHELANRYQQINAPNEIEAQKAMFQEHGKNWAFPYDEEAWKKRVKSRMYRPLKALKPIMVGVESDE